jgi:hypothetical protein
LNLGELVKKEVMLTVYGYLWEPDIPIQSNEVFSLEAAGLPQGAARSGADSKPFRLAVINAFKMMDNCVRLDQPLILPVPGDGYDIGDDTCAPPDAKKKWEVRRDWLTVALVPQVGPLEELLSKRGLSGGVRIRRVWWEQEGHRVCVDFEVWAEAKIFGREWDWKKGFTECFNVGDMCVTVFNGGVGVADVKVEICYEPPNRVCVELEVRVFNFNKDWSDCRAIG